MHLHALQHVVFEDPAYLAEWASAKKHTLTRTSLFSGEPLPDPEAFDWLVILGGPMSVHDTGKHPWLLPEIDLIRRSIEKGKIVLGICLGAQLIAEVLGGQVAKNPYKEVGWFPVNFLPGAARSRTFHDLPPSQMAFHWHGETFSLPPDSIAIAESTACKNQAFEYADRVIGLQFHLESTLISIQNLIQHRPDDLLAGRYVQNAKEILSHPKHVPAMHQTLSLILNRMAEL